MCEDAIRQQQTSATFFRLSSRQTLSDELASRTDSGVGPGHYDLQLSTRTGHSASIKTTATSLKAKGKKLPGFGSTSPRLADSWMM